MTGFVVQGHICSLFNSDDFITYCYLQAQCRWIRPIAQQTEERSELSGLKCSFTRVTAALTKNATRQKNGRRRSDSSARSRSSRPPRAWRHRHLELFVLDCGRERARASSQQNKEGKQTSSLYTYATRLFLIKRPSMCCVVSRNGQAR